MVKNTSDSKKRKSLIGSLILAVEDYIWRSEGNSCMTHTRQESFQDSIRNQKRRSSNPWKIRQKYYFASTQTISYPIDNWATKISITKIMFIRWWESSKRISDSNRISSSTTSTSAICLTSSSNSKKISRENNTEYGKDTRSTDIHTIQIPSSARTDSATTTIFHWRKILSSSPEPLLAAGKCLPASDRSTTIIRSISNHDMQNMRHSPFGICQSIIR